MRSSQEQQTLILKIFWKERNDEGKKTLKLKTVLFTALTILFISFFPPQKAPQPAEKPANFLVVVGGRLIDGTGAAPMDKAVVIMANDRIVACGKRGQVSIRKEAKIIDAKGKTIIPGLIDAHLHFTYPPKKEEFFFINKAISAFRAAAFLRKMLFIGVTTVRDVASFQKVGYEASKAFNSGILEGSRPIVTGPGITSTGGHGREDYRLGIVEEADGADGFRRAVRARIKQGADLIKVLPPYSREEILAAVEEAHFHEKFITVHSGVYKAQYDFVRWAVEAGADCIEHAYALPEDVIPQIAAKKIYCTPTLSILIKLGKQYKEKGPEWDWKVKKYFECRELFSKLRAAGVRMAVGTDAVGENMAVYPHFYFEEVENFVSLGASPMEAIVAATKTAAEVCAASDRLGTIEEGKIADLVILAGDPLKDIKQLRTAELVIQAGRLISLK